MSRYAQQHTALRVAYLGAAYQGSAYTPGADTVAGRLLDACIKTCLIADRESCGLSLGGRTDKGVSAFGQVFALRLRSNLPPPAAADGDASAAAAGDEARREKKEIDYVRVLNRVLPEDIRVLAAQPVAEDFSARFSASHRTYRYFFVRGALDLAPMREAAAKLQGEFDFRNFCKIDPAVSNFRRTVLSATIQPAGGGPGAPEGSESPLDVFEFEVRGTAFLYHQVRCMVAVLFLVGKGLERPSIVDELLDIAKHPARPNYEIAPDGPLLLHEIGYEGLAWGYGAQAAEELAREWARAEESLVLRAAMLHAKRASLLRAAASAAPAASAAASLASPHKGPAYVPLLERPTAASVEMVHAQAAERAGRKKRAAAGDSEAAAAT